MDVILQDFGECSNPCFWGWFDSWWVGQIKRMPTNLKSSFRIAKLKRIGNLRVSQWKCFMDRAVAGNVIDILTVLFVSWLSQFVADHKFLFNLTFSFTRNVTNFSRILKHRIFLELFFLIQFLNTSFSKIYENNVLKGVQNTYDKK